MGTKSKRRQTKDESIVAKRRAAAEVVVRAQRMKRF
jgi:hypothetical protein